MSKLNKELKENINSCIHAIIHCDRKGLIDEILKHSEDEYENTNDILELAKKDDVQLKVALSDIINYYLNK